MWFFIIHGCYWNVTPVNSEGLLYWHSAWSEGILSKIRSCVWFLACNSWLSAVPLDLLSISLLRSQNKSLRSKSHSPSGETRWHTWRRLGGEQGQSGSNAQPLWSGWAGAPRSRCLCPARMTWSSTGSSPWSLNAGWTPRKCHCLCEMFAAMKRNIKCIKRSLTDTKLYCFYNSPGVKRQV